MSTRKAPENASGSKGLKPWMKNLIFAAMILVLAAALYFGVRAAHSSKGSGLQALCRCLNIPVSAAIAIGDSENDCSMLRDAGLPLAMGNAIDDVKAASEYVMPDCDHDGVAEAIERFLLAQR